MSLLLGFAPGARLNAGPDLEPTCAKISASGAKAIRVSAQWDRVEQHIGDKYDWSTSDQLVAAAHKYGMGIVLEGGTRDNNIYASGMPAAYVKFMGALAQRYDGQILATAGPNEPNHVKVAPHPDPISYTNLILKPMYDAIKKVAPTLIVLTGGLGGAKNDASDGDAVTFLTTMYKTGAHGYFDALAFHPYTHPLSWFESLQQKKGGADRLVRARAEMVLYGDSAKKIWQTEYGAPTGGPRPLSEDTQQAHMLQWFAWCSHQTWSGPLFWFDWIDDIKADPLNSGDFMGVLHKDGTQKKSYATYQGLAHAAAA